MIESETKSSDYLIDLNGTAHCLAEGCKWEETDRIVLDVCEIKDNLPDISLDYFFKQYLVMQCQNHHTHFGHNNNDHNIFNLSVRDAIVGRIAASSNAVSIGINRGSLEIIKQIGTIKPRDALE